MKYNVTMLATANFIKRIRRGKEGAHNLSYEDAKMLYKAILDNRVSDLELGAILLAMRIKGEFAQEIRGFLEAFEKTFVPLQILLGKYAPVVIQSYNGSDVYLI